LVSWPFHDSSTSSCAHNMEIRQQIESDMVTQYAQ
jgi:hypothetical protein